MRCRVEREEREDRDNLSFKYKRLLFLFIGLVILSIMLRRSYRIWKNNMAPKNIPDHYEVDNIPVPDHYEVISKKKSWLYNIPVPVPVARDVTKILFIEHWREQGIECPCGQLLDYNHVSCKIPWNGLGGVEVVSCLYNESLSYKIRQPCVSCMEEMYSHYRLTKDFKCLLCDAQRSRECKKVNCSCYCDQCRLGNYKCKCCRQCKREIRYCLENNRCLSLIEVQTGMGGLCEIGKPLATQSTEVVGRNNNDD